MGKFLLGILEAVAYMYNISTQVAYCDVHSPEDSQRCLTFLIPQLLGAPVVQRNLGNSEALRLSKEMSKRGLQSHTSSGQLSFS